MDRMSPLDASFLHVENDVNHMHIASVAIFEGPAPRYQEIVDMVASKLHLEIGIAGGLGFETLSDVLETCPAVNWVVVGRAAIARAMLVGLDRSLRDLRARVS